MLSAFLRYLWEEWFRQVGEALLIGFIVTTFAFTSVGVIGNSMYPTLKNGERVLVPKYRMWLVRLGFSEWQRGEVVIIKPPEGAPNAVARFPVLGFKFRPYFIKRIVALPGDRVRIERGQLFVNDYPVPEDHIRAKITPYPDDFPRVLLFKGEVVAMEVGGMLYPVEKLPPYLVPILAMLEPPPPDLAARSEEEVVVYVPNIVLPEDHYFVLGDNRTLGGSEDSRIFGPLKGRQIAGNASHVIWPVFVREEGRLKLNLRRIEIPEGFKKIPPPSQSP